MNAPTPSLESSSASPSDASKSPIAEVAPAAAEATPTAPEPANAGDAGGDASAQTSAHESVPAEGGAAGAPEKKKRRRRRRKKSGAHAGQAPGGEAHGEGHEEGADKPDNEEVVGEGSDAAEGASAEGEVSGDASAPAEGEPKSDKRDKKKKKPKKEQRAPKESRERPAFNVGDVVFGKILEVGDDAIFVDLSGKANAIFDKLELLLPEDVADQVEEEARRAEARAEAIISGRDPDAAEAAVAADHAKEGGTKVSGDGSAEVEAPAAAGYAPSAEAVTNGSSDAAAPAPAEEGAVPAALDSSPHRRIVQPRLRSEPPAGTEPAGTEPAAAEPAVTEPAATEPGAEASLSGASSPEARLNGHAAETGNASDGGETAAASGDAASDRVEAAAVEGDLDAAAAAEAAEAAESVAPGVVQLPRVVLEPGAPFVGVVHNDGGRGGLVVLTHHPKRASKAKPNVAAAYKQKSELFGLVTGVIKGGVEVDVDGVRAFAPGSHMDLRLGADLHPLVGRRLPFFVTQYGKRGRDVVLSRRALLEAEARVARESALAKITPGSTVPGVVRSVVQFGAFIDIGGVEGLVPLTEMSHNRGDTPSDVFKVGTTVDVKILRVDEKGKVWLSRKATIPDPWLAVAEKYAFGSRHTGKIVRLQPFGAFIELEPGVDGLVHTADLSIRRIEHPSEVVTVGDPIEVVVASLDPGSHRIGLHPAPTGTAAEEAPQRVQLHKVVKVQVVSIETGGLTVRVLGATGRHARGFIPAGGTGTPRGTDLRKAFPPGHTLDAKVIEMDPKRSEIKLSIRAMQEESERSAYQQYRQQVKREAKFGTFADLLAKRGPTQK